MKQSVSRLLKGEVSLLYIKEGKIFEQIGATSPKVENYVVLSGSFNPFHEGHG